MKARRVFVLVEMESEIEADVLARSVGCVLEGAKLGQVHQVHANVVRMSRETSSALGARRVVRGARGKGRS